MIEEKQKKRPAMARVNTTQEKYKSVTEEENFQLLIL